MIRRKTLLITLLLFGLFAVRLSADEAIGVVTDIRGTAIRSPSENGDALTLSSPVYIRDKVKTDRKGYVVITLGNASVITIGPETEWVVDQWLGAQNSDLEIVSGQIGFETDDTANANVETIRTVFGMIGVRG